MKKNLKWIVVGCLLIGLVTFITLIKGNNISGFDKAVYELVTHRTSPVIDKVFEIFTFFGSTVWMIALGILVLIFVKDKKKAMVIVWCLIIAIGLNYGLKLAVHRARPAEPEYRVLAIETSPSFPSGHTTAAVSTYGIMVFLIMKSKLQKNKKRLYSAGLISLIVLVGISRIYLAAHFASDVLGAMCAATSVLIIYSHIVWNAILKKS